MFLNRIADILSWMNKMETLIDQKWTQPAEEETQRTAAELQKQHGRLEIQAERERRVAEEEEQKPVSRNELLTQERIAAEYKKHQSVAKAYAFDALDDGGFSSTMLAFISASRATVNERVLDVSERVSTFFLHLLHPFVMFTSSDQLH